MTAQDAIALLAERRDLSQDQARDLLHLLMTGQATPVQIGAILTALRMKGESIDELTGFATTMRALVTRVNTSRRPLVDTCGTGGDGSGTFNISTTAAFVVAGAGIAVAKHGNRSASSKCGSADVLEALGVNLEVSAETIGHCIDDIGIGFLFARSLHGAMKHVAQARAELKVRTVFNLLGPLTNPAGADRQVIGVFDRNRLKDMATVLHRLGAQHAYVVTGSDGLDEITLSGPTYIAEATPQGVTMSEVNPSSFGVASAPNAALKGGDASENARILRAILTGETGARRDIVIVNAAAAIRVAGAADDWKSAVDIARASIDNGAAHQKLEALIRFTNAKAA